MSPETKKALCKLALSKDPIHGKRIFNSAQLSRAFNLPTVTVWRHVKDYIKSGQSDEALQDKRFGRFKMLPLHVQK